MPKSTPKSSSPRRGYAATKEQLQKRLRRIAGQVRGVEKMVDEDRWCPDILIQIAAIRSALDQVALGLANGHVQHCIHESAGDPSRQQEMTTELMDALGQLVR
jgi:DNA-binding FrmR family transcriptional regulator